MFEFTFFFYYVFILVEINSMKNLFRVHYLCHDKMYMFFKS